VASAVVAVEVPRAVRRAAIGLLNEADRIVRQLDLIEPNEIIRSRAALLDPPTLRTLDAIHLATAIEVGADLEALITYDQRLRDAAHGAAVPVLSPS
jgi:predicted nucleic acid-binding protein